MGDPLNPVTLMSTHTILSAICWLLTDGRMDG